ncbi:MAG: DNA repair protein RecO C-terminal domain-containing protein [Porphyromonas sp.]|nr:DNA repair protein RecO C-terminal domain-containing protein [Porphyromonas sp.]
MLITTEAIVLHRFSYNDKNNIAHLYTKEAGRLSCILPNSRGRKGGRLSGVMSPPIEVELVVKLKPRSSLCHVSQVQIVYPMPILRLDPIKQSVALFLCEFLYRVLGDFPPDARLYDFISRSFRLLDDTDRSTSNFHLSFLYHLLDYLGFCPNLSPFASFDPSLGAFYFDLKEGCFSRTIPTGPFVSPSNLHALARFARINYDNMHLFQYTRAERLQILNYLVTYYRLHLPPFGELRTLSVFSEVFS